MISTEHVCFDKPSGKKIEKEKTMKKDWKKRLVEQLHMPALKGKRLKGKWSFASMLHEKKNDVSITLGMILIS